MNTLYIVSCGTRQRAVRLPAAQLYIGAGWNAAITHARHFAAREQDVRILSVRHGLLSQSHLLDPYDPRRDQLQAENIDRLVARVRAELPREPVLPLRVVMLANAEEVAIWRAACHGTRFEAVPVRAPLVGLEETRAIEWLQSGALSIECKAPLPLVERLSQGENQRLHESVRAASLWWSRHLMRDAPPPDSSLFADALALELGRAWDEFYEQSRGEWPEDLAFPLEFHFRRAPTGPLAAAFETFGMDAGSWWKREWRERRFSAQMSFSMDTVQVQVGARTETVWESGGDSVSLHNLR